MLAARTVFAPSSSSSAYFGEVSFEARVTPQRAAPQPRQCGLDVRAAATEQEPVDVIIVGAGLAGLACARRLKAAGVSFEVLEASSSPGGRVKTDYAGGFLVDRGFQVFIEAYPTVRKELDYRALDLRKFYPGALVRYGGRAYRVADPFRAPLDSVGGLFNPIGSVQDKLKILALRLRCQLTPVSTILARPETSTLEFLRAEGFSEAVIERFFRPFYQGILLAPLDQSSSRMFEFVFKMLAEGDISLPAAGIGALAEQLAADFDGGRAVRYGTAVSSIDRDAALGLERRRGDGGPEAERLGVTCVYFEAPESPVGENILVLNGDGPEDGPVNNVVCLTDVSPELALEGQRKALVSVTMLGVDEAASTAAIDAQVRTQLSGWFGGDVVREWRLLRVYKIRHAQPALRPVEARPAALAPSLFVAGDHRDTTSFNGAMESGQRAAEAALAALRPR
eukprot:tig00001024_g6336.t1